MTDHAILHEVGPGGDARKALELAWEFEEAVGLRMAASAIDRAFGLDPDDEEIEGLRRSLLDRLGIEEHGIRFRYVPAGTFLMGSDEGDPDERPVHPVRLGDYWMSETTVSWARHCALIGWEPPPDGMPKGAKFQPGSVTPPGPFALDAENRIRLQYCEDWTTHARDWHCHHPGMRLGIGAEAKTYAELGKAPPREDASKPYTYDAKPMVAVSWQLAVELCDHVSSASVAYRLPTEAEWEKAARGGLIGARYAWGDAPASPLNCDFGRFDELSILRSRTFAPNGYGLYAMYGSVWEWTSDPYDSRAYATGTPDSPSGEAVERVLRGGSWADCAGAVTVSFRSSRASAPWQAGVGGAHMAPNIGFRICRTDRVHALRVPE